MTGPEHYAESERLLELARAAANAGQYGDHPVYAAEAQVHATLALTAATIDVGAQATAARMFEAAIGSAGGAAAAERVLDDPAFVKTGDRMRAWVGAIS